MADRIDLGSDFLDISPSALAKAKKLQDIVKYQPQLSDVRARGGQAGEALAKLRCALDILQEKDDFSSDLYGDQLRCVRNLVEEALKALEE